jgi:hypothetical protein
VAQGGGPEFKSQYCQKRKKKLNLDFSVCLGLLQFTHCFVLYLQEIDTLSTQINHFIWELQNWGTIACQEFYKPVIPFHFSQPAFHFKLALRMAFRRQVKNFVKNYSDAEIKVREATSNDPWGPSSSLMLVISDLTFNMVSLSEIMNMLWQRLSDHGKNWRHVYKSLTLMDYLIKNGSKKVIQHCREGFCNLQMLKDFQHIDEAGKDQGNN